MALLRGQRAKVLVECVINALGEVLPSEVESVQVRVNAHGGLIVRALPTGAELDIRLQQFGGLLVSGSQQRSDFDPSRIEGRDPLVWGSTAHYVGTWLPFLPRPVLARINAQSATEAVQDAVEALLQLPWPFGESRVKTEKAPGAVRVWFHDGKGGCVTHPFEVPVAACLG